MPERRPTLAEDGAAVLILDQTRLPGAAVMQRLATLDDAARAIRSMQVRGAPLIGATAAYGVALALADGADDARLDAVQTVLAATRPTAVNLNWALQRMVRVLRPLPAPERRERAWAEARAIAAEDRAVVLLEAPHRIEALADSLAVLGDRPITFGRELTKQFEEIATVPASDGPAWLAADAHRTRGEFVLVVHGAPVAADAGHDERVLRLLLAELPLKTAVRLATDITGRPKNSLYDAALALRKAEGDG